MTTGVYIDKLGRRNAMISPMPQRFWKHVDRREADECWQFDMIGSDGYGCLTIDRKQRAAHRVSWELHHGEIPKGLCVLHKCDNPPCVNPDHLFLGTKSDNSRDAVRKGRQVIPNKGKTHCKNGHELTPENIYRRGDELSGVFWRQCRRLLPKSESPFSPTRQR